MKAKYFAIIAVMAGITLSGLSSCVFHCVKGSGNIITDSRQLSDFNKINIEGGFKVILKQDSSLGLKITADDNILKYIKVSVDDHRLHVYSNKSFCNTGELTLNIGVKNLEEIKGSGAVDISADGKIVAKDINFKFSGASKVTMELNAANVTTRSSGATELNLKGQATSHYIDLSGVGKVHAFDFVVGSYEIHTTGAGNCEVNVLNAINVHSTGASEVRYRGNPTTVTNDKSGASSLEKVN
jgi:hypothetical protein